MPVVLCYGDSNTHGTMPLPEGAARGRYGRDQRWPGVAEASLGGDWRLIEEGLPGRTTCRVDPYARAERDGLALLPAILETHRPLDAAVLMLGTNDTKARFPATGRDIGLGVERLGRTVLDISGDAASGPDGAAPRLLIVAPPPLPEDGPFATDEPGAAALSREAAVAIREAATRLGAAFLDAGEHAAFSRIDGVHLDAAGHASLGAAVAEALRAMLP